MQKKIFLIILIELTKIKIKSFLIEIQKIKYNLNLHFAV